MGFEIALLKLTFDEASEFHGLEVRAKRLSIAGLLEIIGLRTNDDLTGVEKLEKTAELLAKGLKSWNLEEDGVPVPVSVESLLAQPPNFVSDVTTAWMGAGSAVSPPLPQPSTDGEQSLEASIPMEPVSPSLPNSPEPDSSTDSSSDIPPTP
jgi:hypothetical protein